ncbi:MAG: M16 family metallopeptidase, partial [Acidobacteriota bacterium]
MIARVSLLALALAACAPAAAPSAPRPAPLVPAATPAVAPTPAPAPPVAAAPVTSAAHKVRSVDGITEYRLDNGLQVLLFPDPSQSTITVNVTYLVGSRLEGYGETGMAHLLEHMMFKGSPKHRNVLKLLEEKGGQANGSTSYDRTNYYETLPASQANLDWTLELEADRMRNASISPDDLKTEFSVVRNEFEAGENQPTAILDERVTETAFLWHNYGKPTIGSRQDIERVPASALHVFYDKYYQPDDAVLIVSGKFDDAAALASIEKTFGAIAKPTRTLAATYTVEPPQDGERTVTLRRNGDVFAVALAYHTVSGASPDHAASEAAVDILTHEAAGRLYKKLVETKLAASVRVGFAIAPN